MKKMNKKGFTLMEMLIVIAIIAILIAIAIPTFTNALEKSRQRTDMANARSLKSLVVASYMAQDEKYDSYLAADSGVVNCYLVKGGQDWTNSASGDIVKCEAAWTKKDANSPSDGDYMTYSKGTAIMVGIDVGNNGAIVGSIPYIPGNAS